MFVSTAFFKKDPRKGNSSVARMVVRVPVAVLHVVWTTRVGETKILGNDILTLFKLMLRVIGTVCEIPFEKGAQDREF